MRISDWSSDVCSSDLAMGAGLPVVSFDCQWGPAEMIEHDRSGLLVPNGDGAALGEAIVALCNDPARRAALGQAARDRMADFGHDQVLAPIGRASCRERVCKYV